MGNPRVFSRLAVQGRPGLTTVLRLAVALALGTNLLYGASVFFVGRPPGGYATLWDGWLYHVATTLPAALVAIRAIADRRWRHAWVLVAFGILLNTVGNLVYTYHDQNLSPIPFPAPADIGYLGSYLAFAAALVILTHGRIGAVSKAVRLDGLVIGLSAAAVAVALWFDGVLRQTGSSATVLVGLAYPLFDVVFVVIVVSGLAPARFRPDWLATLFMLGAGAFIVGDIVYFNRVTTDTSRSSSWLELTWTVGILLFGLAPWARENARAHRGEVSLNLAAVPLVSAMMALGVVAAGVSGQVPLLASWLAIAAVAAALARVALTVRELRRANEAFRQARTDDLTKLLNRRGFAEELDSMVARSATDVFVLMVDLDGFKEVNDSLGHHVGDLLLVVVAERFARTVPKGAPLARLGGDEFGIALIGQRALADDTASALLATLDNPISLDGVTIRVGASIGIAGTPEHGTGRGELLRRADVAMYDAKSNHLGSAWYEAAKDPNSRERLALIGDLRAAIDDRAFEMHYQPTVDVLTGRVVGMEALIRWNHPSRGMLLPEEFIPLAERVGLTPAITRAVLDLSVAHLADTRARGHDLRLSVNISAHDLVDDELARYVRSTLDAYQVPANILTLEITETALSIDTVRAERTLNALRSQGIRISIDDFGVGYSSMSQLLNLPVDELKLDRSFIEGLGSDIRAQAILCATVQLGRTLGLDIVAEGVETENALAEVTSQGVDLVQGFYLCHPLPAGAFERFVTENKPGGVFAIDGAVGPRASPEAIH